VPGGGLGFTFKVGGPISGSVTKWKVILPDYKEYPEILDLRAVLNHALVHCLALQALRTLRDPDQVARSLPRSSGLWTRSSGPLAGRQGFW
jgi:hypothetical protein